MVLNDFNLLYLLVLISLSTIGLALGLSIWGSLLYFSTRFIAESFWPWFLGIVDRMRGGPHPRTRWILSLLVFVCVWVLVPVGVFVLGTSLVVRLAAMNFCPRLVEHGHSGGERIEIGGVGLRWVDCGDESVWMMESEVTQQMWREWMGDCPGLRDDEDEYPICVQNVGVIRLLLDRLNRDLHFFGWEWAVPNINQWIAACNADSEPQGLDFWKHRAWLKENSSGEAHPVKALRPNKWGLFDMVGNAAEVSTDVGEANGDLVVVGLDYKTSFNVERGQLDWVMAVYPFIEEDGWIFYEGDTELGWRFCLRPTAYAKAHSGVICGVEQTAGVRRICNYVAVYGIVGLLVQILIWICGDRVRAMRWMRWVLWFSVAEEFLRHAALGSTGFLGSVRKWLLKVIAMLFKYTVGQVLGYPISSLVASAFPSLPDYTIAPPDEWLMAIVVLATFPLLLLALVLYKNIHVTHLSALDVKKFYLYLIVPAVVLVSAQLIRCDWRNHRMYVIYETNPYCVHPIHMPELVEEDEQEID